MRLQQEEQYVTDLSKAFAWIQETCCLDLLQFKDSPVCSMQCETDVQRSYQLSSRYIEFFTFDYDSLPISFQSGIAFNL